MALEDQPVRLEEASPLEAAKCAQRPRWLHKVAALLYIFFCFELGAFLLLFPWLEAWQQNYFSSFGLGWREFWSNAYLRGAVSGLGLVNIAIAFTEVFRLRRFSRPK